MANPRRSGGELLDISNFRTLKSPDATGSSVSSTMSNDDEFLIL
jgi:hypothetical protein